MASSRWTIAGTVAEGEPFAVDGGDVWLHKWLRTDDDSVQLPHPNYPAQLHRFSVYEIQRQTGVVRFAAAEVSANVWAFYV